MLGRSAASVPLVPPEVECVSQGGAQGHVDALADSYRLVLIDARGHGGSGAPHDIDSYRIDRQVDDVIAVLDELSISRTAFWGASMSGIIGLNLLARHPERLTGLIAGGAHAGRVVVDVQTGSAVLLTVARRRSPAPA